MSGLDGMGYPLTAWPQDHLTVINGEFFTIWCGLMRTDADALRIYAHRKKVAHGHPYCQLTSTDFLLTSTGFPLTVLFFANFYCFQMTFFCLPTDFYVFLLPFYWLYTDFLLTFTKGKVDKKNRKKLTNVSLVCMYVGRKSEMSVFFLFFSQQK